MGAQTTAQRTVLLVDDDPTTLLICRKALEAEGFRVFDGSGSSEALKLCADQNSPIDLLLTDLLLPPPEFQMTFTQNTYPRMHGHDLLTRVVEMKKSIHVVCMSSPSATELAAHGMKLDGVSFVPKPFPVENLLRVVRAILAGPLLRSKETGQVAAKGKDIRWYG